jgi:Flp pilus assembly protein TadB
MSATRPSRRGQPEPFSDRSRPREISQLRARRRALDRRRRLFRLDLAVGVLAAIILMVATPGLAIAALVAGVMLIACFVSVILERRRRRRHSGG